VLGGGPGAAFAGPVDVASINRELGPLDSTAATEAATMLAAVRAAAERETLEETGIELNRHGRYLARLSDLITRHHSRWRPMVVTPYVFEWQGPKAVLLNHEVERVVWVPLDYLAAGENQSQLPWPTPIGTLNMPCCRYQGACIWGLSYSMLQELLATGINTRSEIPQ